MVVPANGALHVFLSQERKVYVYSPSSNYLLMNVLIRLRG